ncbi:hypothetical protein D3C71_887310 [compost metagenome]
MAADPHAGAEFLRNLHFPDVVDDTAGRNAAEMRQRDILADVFGKDQPELLAVFGNISQTRLDRPVNVRRIGLFPVDLHGSGDVAAIGPTEHAHGELGAAGPHQARYADHLAGPDLYRDVLDHLAAGMLRMVNGPVVDFEDHIADFRHAGRIPAFEIAIDHAAHDLVLVDRAFMAIERADGAAVAQNCDAVGDFGNLVQLVADHDRGNAAPAEFL